MKSIIIFLIAVIFSLKVNAQPCPPGNHTFTSQAQINAFPSCQIISGNLTISGSDITNLTPLNNIVLVAGDVIIENNTALGGIVLPFLSNIQGSLEIKNNPSLAIIGMANLSNIQGSIVIRNNPSAVSIGLAVSNVPGNIQIDDNDDLQVISMSNLDTVGSFIRISNCNSLATLSGLGNLHSVGGLQISDNNSLTSLAALNNLETASDLFVMRNPALTDLTGLDNVTTVSVSLEISGNNSLTSLAALNNVTSGVGILNIEHNPALTNLNGLNNLASASNINITGNSLLSSIEALGNLTGNVEILCIENNPALTDLEGLNNLASASVWIGIYDNNSLADISALENIDLSTALFNLEELSIVNNPVLAYCHLQNICDYLSLDPLVYTRDISGNSGACVDEAAVVAACNEPISVSETDFPVFHYYPNPVTDILSINSRELLEQIEVYNLTGQKVLTESGKNQVNMAALAPGSYIVKIISRKATGNIKVVKN